MAGTDRIRKTRRAALMILAVTTTAIVGVVAGPVRAGIAPTATAKGTAVAVRPLDTGVGIATASADENGASSKAAPVRVLGRDVGATTADGNEGRSEAAARARVPLTTGDVEILPRSATADKNATESRSTAHNDVVTAHVPNLISMEVLSSDAEAVWTPRSSWSGSSVDGAKVALLDGDLVIVLMHAEGNSDGRGRLYLVRINDATFVDSDRGNYMTLTVPDIFTIQLAGSDARGGRFTGQVVRATWFNDAAFDQFAAAVDASGGSADPATETFAITAASDDASGGASSDGRLPTTGSPIAVIVLAALTLIEIGAGMVLVRSGARARA